MSSTPSEHTQWTIQGSQSAAESTYASVRSALKDLMQQKSIEVFLQGSYANTTNIRADSDVDVVVMTTTTYFGRITNLAPTARARFDSLPAGTYGRDDLRKDVQEALIAYYGTSRVSPKNKCIKVEKSTGYLDADVVPCFQYRNFTKADPNFHTDFIEGIRIVPATGPAIINYPKEHIRRGQEKNARCNGHYKKTVRQLKHLRNRAIAEGRLPDGIAPGYLLECMAFNVPDEYFEANDTNRLRSVAAFLSVADKTGFYSADGVQRLFVDDPGDFSLVTAKTITDALWAAF